MQGYVVWITGLPGSGKSSLADEMKKILGNLVVLRMDDLRKIATPEPSYSEGEREILYRSLVFFAKALSDLGHNVVIDATGHRRKWRDLARELIPVYYEIYLRCPPDVCAARERKRSDTRGAPRDVYKKGAEGWPVPGVAVPYEEPINPELMIDMESATVEEAGEQVRRALRSAGLHR